MALGLLLCVGGCSSGAGAIVQTMQASWGRGDPSKGPLNPNYEYLRVVADGRVAVLALGDVEGRREAPTEVWYSAQKEVVRFQNGRLVAATGLTTEWRSVAMPSLPAWEEIIKSGELRWTRIRDVMPGYRFGIHDQLLLKRIEAPSGSHLLNMSPESLNWFEEVTIESQAGEKLPPARYAVQRRDGMAALVVYGEQCLEPRFCFSWQRWSAKADAR